MGHTAQALEQDTGGMGTQGFKFPLQPILSGGDWASNWPPCPSVC